MKKLLILFSLILILCGCSFEEENNEFDNFKHYKTEDLVKIVHNGGYAIALLPPTEMIGSATVLLYQVDKDDYILLNEISITEVSFDESHIRYYKDRLYVLESGIIREYILDGPNTKSNNVVIYDYKKITDNSSIYIGSIEKIEDNYIYYTGSTTNGLESYDNIKCSLESRICELDN